MSNETARVRPESEVGEEAAVKSRRTTRVSATSGSSEGGSVLDSRLSVGMASREAVSRWVSGMRVGASVGGKTRVLKRSGWREAVAEAAGSWSRARRRPTAMVSQQKGVVSDGGVVGEGDEAVADADGACGAGEGEEGRAREAVRVWRCCTRAFNTPVLISG